MNIKIIKCLAILIVVFSCENDKKNDLLEELNLKGKVKSVRITSYDVIEKFGDIEKDDVIEAIYFMFNQNQDVTGINTYKSEGSINSKVTFIYDDKGKAIQLNNYNADGELTSYFINKYDNKENLIEIIVYDNDDYLESIITTIYNDKGKSIKEKRYDFKDPIKTYFTYDAEGKKIKKEFYENEEFLGQEQYKYNKYGNVIEIDVTGNYGTLLQQTTYNYDNNGNITIENKYNRYGQLTENANYAYEYNSNTQIILKKEVSKNDYRYHYYEYDDKGNLIEEITYLNDSNTDFENRLYSIKTNKYDDKGNHIEEVIYYYDGSSNDRNKTKYETIITNVYDDKGNLIEKKAAGYLDIELITFKYDKDGRLIETNKSYYDGLLISKTINKYDSSGKIIKSLDYSRKDVTEATHIYDDKGNVIETKASEFGFIGDDHPDLLLKTKNSYKHDKYGNIIEEIIYKYSDETTLTLENEEDKVELESKESFTYDKDGNLVEHIIILASGEITRLNFQYSEFDKKNNWVKAISFKNDLPHEISERQIEYY